MLFVLDKNKKRSLFELESFIQMVFFQKIDGSFLLKYWKQWTSWNTRIHIYKVFWAKLRIAWNNL